MKRRVLLPFALAMCAALAFALPVMGDTLWDQSPLNEDLALFNSISGSPPFGLTYYTVNDITVPASGWMVQSISTTFSAISATWGAGITQGRVVIFPKTSPIPPATSNPGAFAMSPMSAVFVPSGVSPNNHWVVTASGLNMALLPGDYWIGITPVAPAGFFGPEQQYASGTFIGDSTPWWNAFKNPLPLMWEVPAPGTDANILIIGTPGLPTVTESGSWGAIKRLYR